MTAKALSVTCGDSSPRGRAKDPSNAGWGFFGEHSEQPGSCRELGQGVDERDGGEAHRDRDHLRRGKAGQSACLHGAYRPEGERGRKDHPDMVMTLTEIRTVEPVPA